MAKGRNQKNSGGIWQSVVAIFLVGVMIAGVCCIGYASRNDGGKWFKNGDLASWHWADRTPTADEEPENPDEEPDNPEEPGIYSTETLVVTNNKYYGDDGVIPTSATFEMPSAIAFYSVLTDTVKEVTLHASVTPENADNKSVKWTSSNPDAVSVTVSEEDDKTATITYLKTFNEQVTIRCASLEKPSVYDECAVDCIVPLPQWSDNPLHEDFKCVVPEFRNYSEDGVYAVKFKSTNVVSFTLDLDMLPTPLSGSVTGEIALSGTAIMLSEAFQSLMGVNTHSYYMIDGPYYTDGTISTMCRLGLPATPSEAFYTEYLDDESKCAEFDTLFKNTVYNNMTNPDIYTFTFYSDFAYCYNGVVVQSFRKTFNVYCDISNIWVSVEDVEIGNGDIVFQDE